MVILKVVVSKEAPNVKNALWLKPVSGGFGLYALFNGRWQPFKLMDDNGTISEGDDTIAETTAAAKEELIGSVQDAKTANTINGAKAYAKDAADAVIGTSSDTSTDLTLNGLKAYIDAQIAALG